MTVLWTFRRPFMGRPVPRQFMRNVLLDLTTIVPATAYHRRSYAEGYSRYRKVASLGASLRALSCGDEWPRRTDAVCAAPCPRSPPRVPQGACDGLYRI